MPTYSIQPLVYIKEQDIQMIQKCQIRVCQNMASIPWYIKKSNLNQELEMEAKCLLNRSDEVKKF